jgi:dolichol-phosphate mannosyltransferase
LIEYQPTELEFVSKTAHLLQPRKNPALLSLVIPCYNEQEVVPILRRELEKFMQTLPCPCEVIFVNDGSRDQTLFLLDEWARSDQRIKLIGFARNFGHQTAVTAGLDVAKGDAVVIMDADLQDPPHVVHEMLARYREGYDVAYGQRETRSGETIFKRVTAWAFYRLMRSFVHADLPVDAGDFRLLSRECLDALKEMRETHRFLRGMVAWVGFAQIPVFYKRDARAAGETKYPLSKMLKFAWTAALSFSPLPLRASLVLGLVTAFVGFLAGLYALVVAFIHFFVKDANVPYSSGWASIMTITCLVGGAILISVGVLGEYVARIYDEIKARPLYLVSHRRNLDHPMSR